MVGERGSGVEQGQISGSERVHWGRVVVGLGLGLGLVIALDYRFIGIRSEENVLGQYREEEQDGRHDRRKTGVGETHTHEKRQVNLAQTGRREEGGGRREEGEKRREGRITKGRRRTKRRGRTKRRRK